MATSKLPAISLSPPNYVLHQKKSAQSYDVLKEIQYFCVEGRLTKKVMVPDYGLIIFLLNVKMQRST